MVVVVVLEQMKDQLDQEDLLAALLALEAAVAVQISLLIGQVNLELLTLGVAGVAEDQLIPHRVARESL